MNVTTGIWGGNYGIRVGITNRDEYFDPLWKEIEVEMDGKMNVFGLTGGFWNQCPEFRDKGNKVIKDWLTIHKKIPWVKGKPPRFELIPLSKNQFRLNL